MEGEAVDKSAENIGANHQAFFSNVVWQYGLQALKYLLPLIILPYLTRVLDPGGYAVYAYVMSVMAIFQIILDFGFNLSGTKHVAKSKKDVSELGVISGSIFAARLVLSAIVVAPLFATIHLIPILEENALYVFLAYIAVVFKSLLPDFVFQGFENMRSITTRYFISRGIFVVLVFLVVRNPQSLILLPVLDIVSGVIALCWSFWAVKKMFGVGISMPSAKRCITDLCESAIYCVSNISATLMTGLTTILVGIAITDSSQLAYWSLAMTVVSAAYSLYAPITNSLYPHMINNPDYSFAKKLGLAAFPVLIVVVVACVALSDWAMLILGGPEYVEGSRVLQLLSPLFFFMFYSVFFGWPFLGALGKVRQLTATTVVFSILNAAAIMFVMVIGFASIPIICAIRCASEVGLCSSRAIVALFALREETKGKGGC